MRNFADNPALMMMGALGCVAVSVLLVVGVVLLVVRSNRRARSDS